MNHLIRILKKEAVLNEDSFFFILHIFQSSDFLSGTDSFMAKGFYDNEHHGDEEYPKEGRNGCTKDDGNAHRDSGFLLVVLYRR